MRFAYIDSNGNEVPIPSVDALALRIELGAINDDTELYDAQADQWGPAHTHEIFHTLSRAAEEGDQGFVAPLPPVPPPATAERSAPADVPKAEEEVENATRVDETEVVAEAPAEAAPEAAAEAPPKEDETGLTLAPPEPAEDSPEEDDELDLSPVMPDEARLEAPSSAADDSAGDAAFDFGDLSGGLEMEGFADPASPMDFGAGAGEETGFGDGLEQPMEFSSGGIGASDSSATLDLEQPMSEFSPDSPPGWMEHHDVADDGEEAMDFSSLSADVAAPEEVGGDPGQRRAPKDKPSAPKFRRHRSLVGPIVGVVALAAVGVGGYVAWPIVMAQIASRRLPAETEVVIPSIPERLEPQMRSAADAAFASTLADARAEIGSDLAGPPRNWLAGRYFGNASDYGEVETFWVGVQDQLDAVRAIDAATFRSAYERAMVAGGVAADDQPTLLERADSGFLAAARPRAEVFALVDELTEAALDLHDFLVANEDNIDYAPAASITSDPVLEARPSTPEIAAAMRERIDRVTGALDGLDYLDVVTTEGLWTAVLTRVQEVGFR